MKRKRGRWLFSAIIWLISAWLFYQAAYGGWTYFRLLKVKRRETERIETLRAQKIIYKRRKELLETEEGSLKLAKKRLGLLLEKINKKTK